MAVHELFAVRFHILVHSSTLFTFPFVPSDFCRLEPEIYQAR